MSAKQIVDVAPPHISNAQAIADVRQISEAAALLQVIERVAMNPNADIDKLERLMEMREKIESRQARTAYMAALAEMQPHLPVIEERGEIKIDRNPTAKPQSTYALWEDINEAIKPVLAEYGFALSFRTGRAAERIIVTGILSHRDGHSEETTMDLPVEGSGSKNAVQAVGSSTSYGKRYAASALLNLTSRAKTDRDDDGAAAGNPMNIDEKQIVYLQEHIVRAGADIPRFLRYFKIERLSDLRASEYENAIKMLKAKERGSDA